MSKTKKTAVEFTGELKWVVVPPFSKPQTIMEPKPGQENNSHYSVEVECSEAKYKELIKNGVSRMTVLREDENTGKTFIRIKCPKINGSFTAPDPVVKKSDGSTIDVMIGNGSKGTVKADIETFTAKSGKNVVALRFHTIIVDELIPFVKQENPHALEEAYAQDQYDQQAAPFDTTSNEDW